MKLKFSAIDIFDMVVDGELNRPQLEAIADQLYKDRRGGELAHLYSNEEFLNALNEQLGK